MLTKTVWGLLLPFLGTSLGAGCVFFLRRQLRRSVQRVLSGFAAGVMVAASVWSLLIPALEEAEAAGLGVWAFVPAAGGFWVGVLFLLLLDHLIPHLHQNASRPEGPPARLPRLTNDDAGPSPCTTSPKGWRWGWSYAGMLTGGADISAAGALALSLGHRHPELPGGGHRLPAPAGGRRVAAPGLCRRGCLRGGRAAGGRRHPAGG